MTPRSADTPHPATAPATSGTLELRVRYCECDPMNVAHHAAYIPWLEAARTELLRTSGISYAQLEAAGVFLAVLSLQAKYRRPALYDDLLAITARVTGGSRVKLAHDYEVRLLDRPGLDRPALEALRAGGDDLLVTATTTLACIDQNGRPRPLPDWLTAGPGA